VSREPSLHILLADDEEIVQQTLGDYLRDCGHAVVSARSADEVVRAIDRQPFDAVLLDVRMPGAYGLEVVEQIISRRPATPVVIISGHGDADTVIQAMRAGAIDYLRKPVGLLALENAISKAIGTNG